MNKGKQFENMFINEINNKQYINLNNNLKGFIKYLFNNVNDKDIIFCENINNHQKADVSITVNKVTKYVSIKTGYENSVHVEKINDFIDYLKSINISSYRINDLLLYHYGDETFNGSGVKRLSAEEAKLKYQKEIYLFNKHINYSANLKNIIDRFLFKGTNENNILTDAIYYGNIDIGIWASRDEILNYFNNHKSMYMKTPHFSSLTYQNWCRNKNFSSKSESHRYYIQIKWFSILSDMKKIREEYGEV